MVLREVRKMSRKKQSIKREIKPDSKYSSVLLSKFINKMMKGGNKSVVENIVYKSIEILNKKVNETNISGFDKSINNVKPLMEVKSRRVGGSTYQVPIEVKKDRAISLAMRWIIKNSRNKSGKSMIGHFSRHEEATESEKEFEDFKSAKERWISLFEKDYILTALKRSRYNISHSAREAGIDRKYFRKLMHKYDIEVP